MTTLSIEEVEYIAYLARLKLTNEEKAIFQEQLSAILEYAEMIQALDTAGIPPTTSALPLSNVMREDVAEPGLSLEEAMRNAPDVLEDSFHVRPVLGSSQADFD